MRYSRTILNIVITGMMLGLVLFMQYLEQFTKFKEFGITLNMSLVFIILTYHLTGKWQYTFMVIALKFAIGPALSTAGYTPTNIWGNFFNVVAFSTAAVVYILTMKYTLSRMGVAGSFLASALTSIFAVILTLILFSWFVGNPVYYWLYHTTMSFGDVDKPTVGKAMDFYKKIDFVRYYWIPNYWAGLAARNIVSNGTKNALNFFILFTLIKSLIPTHMELFHARSTKVNPTLKTLRDIRTTRSFSNKEVNEKDILDIINVATIQPTVCFSQSFNVIRIIDSDIKDRLVKIFPKQSHIQDSKELIIFTADFNKINEAMKLNGSELKETNMEMFMMATGDAMISAHAANVAAQGFGLGTCYLASIREKASEVSKLLHLPELVFPLVGLAIGYADEVYDEPQRNIDSIQFTDKYDQALLKHSIKEYDNRDVKHHIEQGNEQFVWSKWITEIAKNKSKQSSKDIIQRFKFKSK